MGVPGLLNIPELREPVGVTIWGLLKTGIQAHLGRKHQKASGCCGSLMGTSGGATRQGVSAPSTHPQVELPVLVARLDPEGVDGIGVDGGGLDLEDVGGHGPVGADAHVLVHHRIGQLPANGVGHGAHAAAATHTGERAQGQALAQHFLLHSTLAPPEDEPENTTGFSPYFSEVRT